MIARLAYWANWLFNDSGTEGNTCLTAVKSSTSYALRYASSRALMYSFACSSSDLTGGGGGSSMPCDGAAAPGAPGMPAGAGGRELAGGERR